MVVVLLNTKITSISSIYVTLKMTVFGTFLQLATLYHPAMVYVALRKG